MKTKTDENVLKLVYGTGNPAKLASMRRRLESLDIEIIGLYEIEGELPDITESGETLLENAKIKALAYYKKFGVPVFSCDSGLYFDNVPEDIQPGIHVRNVRGKRLTDQEMIEYYGGLAKKYGDLTARYRNALVLVIDRDHIYEAVEERTPFLITSELHRVVKEGFPLDSLSVDIATGKYFHDLKKNEVDGLAVGDKFLELFKKVLAEWQNF